ncbi:hypothetical protein JCM16418A_01190 [Paenibacillus pini]|uniref:Uncharacterized protein n=1 Tax=Paenibacillus pini JCM 16418 TaxID=1236976 RepID=W7Z0C0_9BACL|nr:hypothetical protein JCM16418_2091 [Paenibacillus pini JCM 16418]
MIYSHKDNGQWSLSSADVQHAIQEEYRSILWCQRLGQLAPPDHRPDYNRIVEEDRRGRLADLTRLYYNLTGCYPVFNKVELPGDYLSGLRTALDHALCSAGNYNRLLFVSVDQLMQKVMFCGMTSEMRWATRLQFLYTNFVCENGSMSKNKSMIGIIKKKAST